MITALEVGEGLASRPGCSLPPGKTRYPLYRRLGLDKRGKSRPPTGIRFPDRPALASSYTDWATRPTLFTVTSGKNRLRLSDWWGWTVSIWVHVIISCENSDKISDKEICQQVVHTRTSNYYSVASTRIRTQTNNGSNLEGSNLVHDKQ
jgi:hypothetical protein